MTSEQSERIINACNRANSAARRVGQKLFEHFKWNLKGFRSYSLPLNVIDVRLGPTREVSDGDQCIAAIIENVEAAKSQLDLLIAELRKEL